MLTWPPVPPPYLEEFPDVRPSDQPLYVTLLVLRSTEKARLQTALEREVDTIVFRTYELSPEKVAEIERWHTERRALLGRGKRGNGADAAESEDSAASDVDDAGEERA